MSPLRFDGARDRTALTSALVVVAVGLVGLNTTAVTIAGHGMVADLDLDAVELGWVMNAYLLVGASLAVVGGRLGDVFGRATTFAAGCVAFAAGSVLAVVGGAAVLLAGRALQGAGAALILPASIEVVHAYASGRRESAGLRWRGIAFAAAFGIGPLIGAVLTQTWGWRSLFAVDAVVAGVLAVGGVRLARHHGRGARRPTSDVAGALLLAVAVFTLVAYIDRIGPWGAVSVANVGVAVVGVAALVGFVVVEGRARHPILHPSLLRNRRILGVNVATVAASLGMVGLPYFFNLFARSAVTFDRTAVAVAVALLPFALCVVLFAHVAGWLDHVVGFRGPALVGTVVMIAGFTWLATIGTGTSEAVVVTALSLCGVGAGVANAGLTGPAVLRLPAGRLNEAAGLATLTRFLGSALAIVLGTSFYLSTGPSGVEGLSASEAVLGGPDFQAALGAVDAELREGLTAATRADTTDGFTEVMAVTAALLVVLLVVGTWLLWPRALRRGQSRASTSDHSER